MNLPACESPSPQLVEETYAQLLDLLESRRRINLDVAERLVCLQRSGRIREMGFESVAEFGETHGMSAQESRDLLRAGEAARRSPVVEAKLREGAFSFAAGAALDLVMANPAMVREGDQWLRWAEDESTKDFRHRVDVRREELRVGPDQAIPLTVVVSLKGLDEFGRARVIASRKAKKALSDGEAFETIVTHYLDDFDPLRTAEGVRRLPDTSELPGRRYVPAEVRRALLRRGGDKCILPFCDNRRFLENAHIVPHALGGCREACNTRRPCRRHHVLVDDGTIDVTGSAECPVFHDREGRRLGVRRTRRTGSGNDPPVRPASA